MKKKWIFFVIAIPLVAYYIYDCFSYKPPKTNIVNYRDIGSLARYDLSFLNEKFDNFMSYSIISEDLNRAKTRKLKWNDDSDEAYSYTKRLAFEGRAFLSFIGFASGCSQIS